MDPTMDRTEEEEDYVFDLKLARLIGLFQIVRPNTTGFRGYNVYGIGIAVLLAYVFAISLLSPAGLYYTANDAYAFVFYSGCVCNQLFCCYKVLNILCRSNGIRECLDVASFKSTSYRNYDRDVFDGWRKSSASSSNVYVAVVLPVLLFGPLCPFVFRDTTLTVKNAHGSYSKYRCNTMNLFLMVSDDTYNAYFYTFYLIETVLSAAFYYFLTLMDVITIFMCTAISCKLELICNAIESLRCKCSTDKRLNSDDEINLEHQYDQYYNNLKVIMMDHQYIMKIIEKYYTIFRPVILAQVFVISTTQVIIWYIASLNFYEGQRGDPILSIRLFAIYPLFIYQLFMTCQLFGTINEKKESIIFALYSSNWTEMNIKCKKLILYGMMMNNANHLKLKYTITNILNMELFTKTLRVCYSIFSMLINYNKKKIH